MGVLRLAMGLNRDRRHKRRATGGRMPVHQVKRKYERAGNPAMTKLGEKKVKTVRVRGGNIKYRALRLNEGSMTWCSKNRSQKFRFTGVVYNAVSNELVRTNTITKGTIVTLDTTNIKNYLQEKYGVAINKNNTLKAVADRQNNTAQESEQWVEEMEKKIHLCPIFREYLAKGKLYGKVVSRPGQHGIADGYILEGQELAFYAKKASAK